MSPYVPAPPEMSAEELRQRNEDLLRRRAKELKPLALPPQSPVGDISRAMANLQPIPNEAADGLVTARSKRDRMERMKKLWAKCGLDARHREKKDLDQTGPWGTTFCQFRAKLGTGITSAIVGDRGTGKTQMGARLIRSAISKERTAFYTTVTAFFLEIERTMGSDRREHKADVMKRFTRFSFLVLDEVGRRSDQPWQENLFFELLDARYRGKLDTFLISNEEKDAFETSIGASIVSRINETGGIVDAKISQGWKCFRV